MENTNVQVMISVIMMTYFHEHYIKKALDTVLKQKRDMYSYEILIADDGSKDRTMEIVQNYKNQYPNMIKVHQNKVNKGITRNLYNAILRANGKYIVLVSGDDYLIDESNNIFERQCQFLESKKDYFAVAITTEYRYRNGKFAGIQDPNAGYRNREFQRDDFLKGENFPTHGIMFRNVFDGQNERRKLSIITKFHRDIDDFTFALLLFDFGKLFIMGDITYAVTTRRRTDINQHNYNTKYAGIDNIVAHIKLIHKLQNYYGDTINLQVRMTPFVEDLLVYIMKEHQYGYIKYLKFIPLPWIWAAIWKLYMNRG